MTENTMFADLLAAQKEMPNLQKTGINPHFKNRFVPLDELLHAVLPILNAHNFVLTQCPSIANGEPALTYSLRHVSGEEVLGTMLLMSGKDGPQDQGSAITYARRYSLMSMLGLTADADDDAEAAHKASSRPSDGQQRPTPPQARPPTYDGQDVPAPSCPQHNLRCNLIPAGTSKASGKPYSSFFSCPEKGCGQNGKSWTVFADKWATDWMVEHNREPAMKSEEFDEVPFE